MKRFLFLALLVMPVLGFAQDCKFLIVKTADGTERTLDAIGVTLTFAAGKANFNTADGTTFQLNAADLESMYFSEVPAAINSIESTNAQMEVYTTTGVFVGNNVKGLQRGAYIVKQYGRTLKLMVK